MAKPPRTEVVPAPVGSHAKPSRGMKFFFCVVGVPKVISPGTLASELMLCRLAADSGTWVNS